MTALLAVAGWEISALLTGAVVVGAGGLWLRSRVADRETPAPTRPGYAEQLGAPVWQTRCAVCGTRRPIEQLDVTAGSFDLAGVTARVTVGHCADNPTCRRGAKQLLALRAAALGDRTDVGRDG